MKNFIFLRAALLLAAAPALAAVPTPPRPLTDPASLASPANAQARPVPVADLVFTRSAVGPVWSADGKGLFLVTNLSGRANIWRMASNGSWPVQMVQSDDVQSGLAPSADGQWLYYTQDSGGNEYADLYRVPAAGGTIEQITRSDDVSETNPLPARNGAIAISHKRKGAAQTNLAVLDGRTVRLLTNENDPQWNWEAVAWVANDSALIANRFNVGGSDGEVWRIDAATGQAALLLGKNGVVYAASDASPDGATIAITSDEGSGQDHAGVLDTGTGKLRWLAATPWEQSSGAMSPDSKSMLVRTNVDGRSALALVDTASLVSTPLPLPPRREQCPARCVFARWPQPDLWPWRGRYAVGPVPLRYRQRHQPARHPDGDGQPDAGQSAQIRNRHVQGFRRHFAQRGAHHAVQSET
ncbi:hypothetical protein [Sandarakinorhabdus sp.]|uniref:hypothetical protein n=1 Tax=Sandarakinorhabdus sp. TaxID=1916663 RepID=UPI00286E8966|nr:hypothetical protein [Sandarakinorhabdus sp.]